VSAGARDEATYVPKSGHKSAGARDEATYVPKSGHKSAGARDGSHPGHRSSQITPSSPPAAAETYPAGPAIAWI
jgi:hypothetical protein